MLSVATEHQMVKTTH